MRCVTSAISKVPNRVRAKCANSSPISVEANVALTAAGVDIAHASRAVDVAQIAMPSGRSSLPKQWSGSPWVFTATVTGFAAVCGAIASSIARVRFRSMSVSTTSEAPSPVTRPALLQPQPPSGCR